MADDRISKAPIVETITATRVFTNFDSLLLIDAGTDGFQLEDENGNSCSIPTGIPLSLAGPAGLSSREITVKAPLTGSLNVSAIFYQ